MLTKKEQENNTVNEIKTLLISDSLLSYGERKTLGAFLARLENEATFSYSLNRMLVNLQTIDDQNGSGNGLSPNIKIVFDKLVSIYGIHIQENKHIVVTSIGAGRKLTNKELVSYFICLIIFILALVIFCAYIYYKLKHY